MALGAAEEEFHAGVVVHTSHCHLRAPWAGLSLLGCSQDPELPEVYCMSWSQGCGRFQACESGAPRRENLKSVLE